MTSFRDSDGFVNSEAIFFGFSTPMIDFLIKEFDAEKFDQNVSKID